MLGSGRIPSLITPLNPGPAVLKKEDESYSRSIEIGRENLRLLPHVRRWCRHIEVEMASYGLLAQATGLPIGHLRVKCQHGITLSESSFLAFEARGFILHNCVGCVHHEEVGQENFGRDVLAERERGDAQKATADAKRRELREEAFEAAAAALETRRITEGSVNGFILGLFEDEEEACRCEQPLLDAARLGPEFFSDAALGVLSDGFTGAHAEVCLTTARLVCNHRKSVPGDLVGAAIRAVEQHVDPPLGGECCTQLKTNFAACQDQAQRVRLPVSSTDRA